MSFFFFQRKRCIGMRKRKTRQNKRDRQSSKDGGGGMNDDVKLVESSTDVVTRTATHFEVVSRSL